MNIFQRFFEELYNKNPMYFDALDRLNEAFYICDANRTMVFMNKAAEKLDGFQLNDIRGMDAAELYGLDETNSPQFKALATERPIVDEEFTYYINGKEIVQLCNSGPIYYNGQLIGAYTIQRDITAVKDIMEQNISLQQALNRQKSGSSVVFGDAFQHLIGNSKEFTFCIDLARRVAKTDSSVMLVGPTGSGKELFAKAIHENSNRSQGPFLALNCAAIPESLIEAILFGTTKGVYTSAVDKEGLLVQADGGTIFLDEVNSMPLSSQAKLLRVLEERRIMKLGSSKETKINVRIISSTNENPTKAIESGHLREDLFYRLSVVEIVIPPLHERKDDIPDLVRHFITQYNERFCKNILGVSPKVMDHFLRFPWPGNVRQLRACVESAMNFVDDGEYIVFSNLPQYVLEYAMNTNKTYQYWRNTKTEDGKISEPEETVSENVMDSIWQEERNHLIRILRDAGGNTSKAARTIGISKQLMRYRLKKYKIK